MNIGVRLVDRISSKIHCSLPDAEKQIISCEPNRYWENSCAYFASLTVEILLVDSRHVAVAVIATVLRLSLIYALR